MRSPAQIRNVMPVGHDDSGGTILAGREAFGSHAELTELPIGAERAR